MPGIRLPSVSLTHIDDSFGYQGDGDYRSLLKEKGDLREIPDQLLTAIQLRLKQTRHEELDASSFRIPSLNQNSRLSLRNTTLRTSSS